jgi:hypothetical protein
MDFAPRATFSITGNMLRTIMLGTVLTACGDDGASTDAGRVTDAGGRDAGRDAAITRDDAGGLSDAGSDAGGDAGTSCIDEGRMPGERYRAGDCDACTCNADGSATCTDRECRATSEGCEYGGVMHAYGERFPASDACNECVCAASGLACTRRPACDPLDEGAILVESLDTPCGSDSEFTAQSVLNTLPDVIEAPFLYRRGDPYGETLVDTTVAIRLFADGFVVCRLPSEDQPAFDIEVVADWVTADGAFDEGLHGYIRKNGFGFVDAVLVFGSAPAGGLDGTYSPACPAPGGIGFFAQIETDGSATGNVSKICEADILLDVGTFAAAP